MTEIPKSPQEVGLNPALRPRTEEAHDTDRRTPAPADSASVQHEEGRAWPIMWLIVTVACIIIGAWLIFF